MARFGKGMLSILALSAIGSLAFATPADWSLKTNYALKGAKVVEVINEKGIADLITIDTGSQSNLRTGVLCSISRDDKQIAQAVVVESNREKSVGLVLNGQQVQSGDAVYITPAN